MIRSWLAVMAVMLLGAIARGQEAPLELLASAEAAFDEGLAMFDQNESLARVKFEESAAAYRAIWSEHGLGGADLLTNAGNASLLANDVGRAIIAYRRALALEPGHRGSTAGLAQARSRVAIAAATRAKGGGWTATLVRIMPREGTLAVGIAAWVIAWGLVLTRIGRVSRGGWRAPTWSIAGCFVAAGACVAAGAADIANSHGAHDAVVIAAEVIGHDGPDARVYPPSFEQSLTAGVEGFVVETRRGWVKFRLGDGVGGRETWVPVSAVEMIRDGA